MKKFRPILEQKHQDHAKHVLIGSKLYYEILKKRGNLQQMKAEKLIKVMDKIPKYKDYIKNHGFIDKDDYKQVVKKIKS